MGMTEVPASFVSGRMVPVVARLTQEPLPLFDPVSLDIYVLPTVRASPQFPRRFSPPPFVPPERLGNTTVTLVYAYFPFAMKAATVI